MIDVCVRSAYLECIASFVIQSAVQFTKKMYKSQTVNGVMITYYKKMMATDQGVDPGTGGDSLMDRLMDGCSFG